MATPPIARGVEPVVEPRGLGHGLVALERSNAGSLRAGRARRRAAPARLRRPCRAPRRCARATTRLRGAVAATGDRRRPSLARAAGGATALRRIGGSSAPRPSATRLVSVVNSMLGRKRGQRLGSSSADAGRVERHVDRDIAVERHQRLATAAPGRRSRSAFSRRFGCLISAARASSVSRSPYSLIRARRS